MSKKKKRTFPPYLKLIDTSRLSRHVRLTLDFTHASFDALEKIRLRAHATSNGELIRDALRVFEWFLRLREEGRSLQVVTKTEGKEHVEIVF